MLTDDRADTQQWYWTKDQKPDEVYIIHFFDSHAEKEGRPIGVPHGSPELLTPGVKGKDEVPRESVESRCLAVW